VGPSVLVAPPLTLLFSASPDEKEGRQSPPIAASATAAAAPEKKLRHEAHGEMSCKTCRPTEPTQPP